MPWGIKAKMTNDRSDGSDEQIVALQLHFQIGMNNNSAMRRDVNREKRTNGAAAGRGILPQRGHHSGSAELVKLTFSPQRIAGRSRPS